MIKNSIGGEFYYRPSLLFKKKAFNIDEYLKSRFPGKYFKFTGGGYYSIIGILQQMNIKPSEHVLLPSYLCHTILYPFKRLKINYRFFKVNKNLEIDIADIKSKINENTKGVYYIEYFGYQQKQETRKFLEDIKENSNIIIIQDLAQSFFSNNKIIGDFAFSSFRKFMPVDGSIILSNEKISTNFQKSCSPYNFYRFEAQIRRYLHIKYNIGKARTFLDVFEKADKAYYRKELLEFNAFNKYLFTRYDIPDFSAKRKVNAKIVFETVKDKAIYKELGTNNVPLGIPVLLADRNLIRKQLIEKNIFCPVHWPLTDEVDKKEFDESWYLNEHLLTIPIRENYSTGDLNHLIGNLNSIIR